MAGNVTSEGFTASLASLNGSQEITATRADIIHSLLTVGYPSRRTAVRTVGRWRERMLVALATGYLTQNLRTTTYFRNLEQSEKVGISFLLGEAFTHWYAQEKMGLKHLVHVAGLPGLSWTPVGGAPTVKAGAEIPSHKSRPDFIGIRTDEAHVFESKGRIRNPSSATIGKALGQVSKIQMVNGAKPVTRCATFFMLKQSGAEGRVIDPAPAADGVKLEFEERDAVAKAYSFFLDGGTNDLSDDVGEGFVGREIEEGVFFAADKEIIDAIRLRPNDAASRRAQFNTVAGLLDERAQFYAGRRDKVTSLGQDGTLLMDLRADLRQQL